MNAIGLIPFPDISLPETHPLFLALTAHGYGICLTDRHFSGSGAAKIRDLRIHECLRQASFSRCPEGFPRIFSCRADSEKHRQTGNTMLRHGATEGPPRHFLKKELAGPCG